MIFEVLLMVSIVTMIYPIINRQTSGQKEKLRDILIVKEINIIKSAFERFLLKYVEDVPMNSVCDVALEDLSIVCSAGDPTKLEGVIAKVYEMGLPENVGKGTNMLGQTYSVRIRKKRLLPGNVDMVEAMVVAHADAAIEVDDLTIRGIAKELGFSGGYIEADYIVGVNWGSDPTGWGDDWEDNNLVSKLNPIQADKSLLVKYKSSNPADNTMLTNILMNNNDITLAKEITTQTGKYLRLIGEDVIMNKPSCCIDTNICTTIVSDPCLDLQVDTDFRILDKIQYDVINFEFGLKATSGRLAVTTSNNVEFSHNLEADTLTLNSNSFSATEAPAMMNELIVNTVVDGSGGLEKFNVKGILYLNALNASGAGTNADSVLNIGALYGKSISNDSRFSDATISNNSSGCTSCVVYLGQDGKSGSTLSTFKNIAVKELNKVFDGVTLGVAPAMDTRPEHLGIVVKYDTTLSEILEAIEREIRVVNLYIQSTFNPEFNSSNF